MTSDEVRSVIGDRVASTSLEDDSSERARPDLAKPKFKSSVIWEGHEFTVFYGFDAANRLASVTLELTDSGEAAAEKLFGTLQRVYGRPTAELSRSDAAIATWDRETESVGYTRLRDAQTAVGAPVTSVNYQPLR